MNNRRLQNEHRRLCATAKGRKALADQVCALAARFNAPATVLPGILNNRELRIRIAFGIYCVDMSFAGDSNVGAFIGNWHIEDRGTDRSAYYPAEFGADIRGTRNPYHGRKATTCEESFERFLISLEGGLRCLVENGYAPHSPATADSKVTA